MGTVADWLVAVATFLVVAVAVFQETIRGWFYKPKFSLEAKSELPNCRSTSLTNTANGEVIAQAIYLGCSVRNVGNITALRVEVFARELRRKRADRTWEVVRTFPATNLTWGFIDAPYFPQIAPGASRVCNIARITDPTRRELVGDHTAVLEKGKTGLAFMLMVQPNHGGHIVSYGEYELDVEVVARNAEMAHFTVALTVSGTWYADESRMLREGVGISVAPALQPNR